MSRTDNEKLIALENRLHKLKTNGKNDDSPGVMKKIERKMQIQKDLTIFFRMQKSVARLLNLQPTLYGFFCLACNDYHIMLTSCV